MALQFNFIKPDYTGLSAEQTYEGIFAMNIYAYKANYNRKVRVYKGVAPTEAEFATFNETTDRLDDLLAEYSIVKEDMNNPHVDMTVKTDANWNNELNREQTVTASATGVASWAVYGSDGEWFLIPQLADATSVESAPVILDTLELVANSNTTLKNVSLFINPYASGLFGEV